MATDTHIKFDGVEGESKHQDHKGEVEILSWSWGVSNASHHAGGGSGKGQASDSGEGEAARRGAEEERT